MEGIFDTQDKKEGSMHCLLHGKYIDAIDFSSPGSE